MRFFDLLRSATLAAALVLPLSEAQASTVVVNGDEWTLSNAGFTSGTGVGTFVSNLVAEFGTTIHAYSNNFGFTQSSLATAMSNAGATYSTGLGITFDLPTLSGYSGIFLGGTALTAGQLTTLSAYVAGGGNVYIAAGTGAIAGGAAGEAAAWNGFLSPFGIQLESFWNGYSGSVTTSGDPLFAGVTDLYVNNPNGIALGADCCSETDIFAIARTDTPAVPLPATGLLLLSGLAAASWRRRRQ